MKRALVSLAVFTIAASLVIAGCTQAAPSPTPAKAPAAPSATAAPAKSAEPTKAAAVPPTSLPPTAVPPTAIPAKKVDFPTKGKAITMIIPLPAGGPTDAGARLLADGLEKALGTPVQVVNKSGAGGQVGLTDLAMAKPDGYTIAFALLPGTVTIYLDERRKPLFGRKDIQPVALHVEDPLMMGVRADSPYKTIKDVFDAAKANPGKIKIGTVGILSNDHLNALRWEQMTGAKFSVVHFDGGAPAVTALLAGDVDVRAGTVGSVLPQVKGQQIRVLAVEAKEPSKFLPGVATFESQGYKLYFSSARGLIAPAGTPKEIVDLLSNTVKMIMDDPQHRAKMEAQGLDLHYMDPAQYSAFWDEQEALVKPLMSLAQ